MVRFFELHRILGQLFFQHMNQILQSTDLHPGQAALITFLSEMSEGQDTSQSVVAKAMKISPAAIAQSLQSLEKQGLVERKQSESDQRKNSLTLTALGRQSAQQIRQALDAVEALALLGISHEDISTATIVMEQIYHNLTIDKEEVNFDIKPCCPSCISISKEDDLT